jgi:hypothetical protein
MRLAKLYLCLNDGPLTEQTVEALLSLGYVNTPDFGIDDLKHVCQVRNDLMKEL